MSAIATGQDTQPRWMLRSGTAVVGPVSTELLLKGLSSGRIPPSSGIRQLRWADFRRLNQIREIAAWQRSQAQAFAPTQADPIDGRSIECAVDRDELLLLTLAFAVSFFHCHVGLAYRIRPPVKLPVVSCVHGANVQVLGQVLHETDPAFSKAREGHIVVGRPADGVIQRTIERRLSDGGLQGVAMLPVFEEKALFGVVELGRFDHPFRNGDREQLSGLARASEANIAKVDNRIRTRAARQLIRCATPIPPS